MSNLFPGVFVQAPTEVDNPEDFPTVDEIRINITKRGDGVAKLLVSSINGLAKLKFIDNIGKFYTDETGTTEIGNSITITGGQTAFYAYAKVIGNGELAIENASDLYSLGLAGSFNPVLSFINDISTASFSGEIDASEIGYLSQLRAINSANNWFAVTGDFNDLSELTGLETFSVSKINVFTEGNNSFFVNLPVLRTFNIASTAVSIDIKYFPPTMTTLITRLASVTYTGGTDKIFNTSDILQFYSGIAIPTAQVDNLLIALSKQSWNSQKTLLIQGTRSSASDDAMTTLQGLGVTVTFI